MEFGEIDVFIFAGIEESSSDSAFVELGEGGGRCSCDGYNSLFNLFIVIWFMFLNVLFLNEACQRTEDDLHVHLEIVVATVLDIQLLALLG